MSTRLNLSSKPFRNRALPWTITTLVSVISVVALVWITRSVFQTRARVQVAQQQVAQLKKESEGLSKQAAAIQNDLTEEQKQTLKSAHLLVDRKHFSWSRLFADLEGTLPDSVKVTRIVVKDVANQGDQTVADLELAVACQSTAIVTEMIVDMERDGIFRAEITSQDLLRGRGESGSIFEMRVRYTPRAGVPIQVAEKSNRPVDTASGNGGTAQ